MRVKRRYTHYTPEERVERARALVKKQQGILERLNSRIARSIEKANALEKALNEPVAEETPAVEPEAPGPV